MYRCDAQMSNKNGPYSIYLFLSYILLLFWLLCFFNDALNTILLMVILPVKKTNKQHLTHSAVKISSTQEIVIADKQVY